MVMRVDLDTAPSESAAVIDIKDPRTLYKKYRWAKPEELNASLPLDGILSVIYYPGNYYKYGSKEMRIIMPESSPWFNIFLLRSVRTSAFITGGNINIFTTEQVKLMNDMFSTVTSYLIDQAQHMQE
jgi:hypothetical protein